MFLMIININYTPGSFYAYNVLITSCYLPQFDLSLSFHRRPMITNLQLGRFKFPLTQGIATLSVNMSNTTFLTCVSGKAHFHP